MIVRERFLKNIDDQFRIHPSCALLGPRQCGKSTLPNYFAQNCGKLVHKFDLEYPEDLLALSNPVAILEKLEGLVIIDEIQRLPELFPLLRVLIDKNQASYLILGSASRDLIRQSSETLAGRIGYIELTPFYLEEAADINKLLIRGGFPRSYLAESDKDSYRWRESYVQTFLERDVPNLGFKVPSPLLYRFWMMLSHYHGQLVNMANLSVSLGVTAHNIRHYLDILSGTFMIRVMQPWFENITKRQVKTPKIFFRDSGLLLKILGINSKEQLLVHPALGSVWEGFALEQIAQIMQQRQEEMFFWRTHEGAELDLFIIKNGKRLGFEIKFADSPKVTKSMHIALQDLKLEHLYVVYPGQRQIPLQENITLIGLDDVVKIFEVK